MSISYFEIFYNVFGGIKNMRLKELREDNDYTQEYVANYLNCKQNTYSQYETELREIPVELLKKLAILYNTSIDYIVEFTDVKTPYKRK